MNMGNEMSKLFGRISSGCCRLGMDGKIAIKTSNGYKTFNPDTNRLVNCDSFVFDIGDDMFFAIPTNSVKKGDIILVGNTPRCVMEAEKNKLTVLNYESGTIEQIIPERHMFMGSMYFYSKIISPFSGAMTGSKKDNGNMLMKYYMMSEMMKGFGGGTGGTNSGMSGMAGMMAMGAMFGGGGMGDMFAGMLDASDDEIPSTCSDDEE